MSPSPAKKLKKIMSENFLLLVTEYTIITILKRTSTSYVVGIN